MPFSTTALKYQTAGLQNKEGKITFKLYGKLAEYLIQKNYAGRLMIVTGLMNKLSLHGLKFVNKTRKLFFVKSDEDDKIINVASRQQQDIKS